MHSCKEELVCKCTMNEQVPYFNGRVFLQNKQEIGKIDEILGPIRKFVSLSPLLDLNRFPMSVLEATGAYLNQGGDSGLNEVVDSVRCSQLNLVNR